MLSNHSAVFFLVLSSTPLVYVSYLMIFKSTPTPFQRAIAKDIEKYPLFEHYSVTQGYSREYMEELIKFLAKKQISAKYSCDETQTYRLFILRGQESQAKNFVARFRETP